MHRIFTCWYIWYLTCIVELTLKELRECCGHSSFKWVSPFWQVHTKASTPERLVEVLSLQAEGVQQLNCPHSVWWNGITLPLHSSPSILVWQSGGHPSQTLWTWFFQCSTLLKSDTVLVDAVPTSENTQMRQAGAKKYAIRKTYADRSVMITTRPLLQTSIPGFFGTILSKHTQLFPRLFFCFPYNHRIAQWQVLGSQGFAPHTVHES